MKNILLLMVAMLLAMILFPIGFFYAMFSRGFYDIVFDIAVSIDQLGNVVCSKLLNGIMISKEGYKFGNPDETISSVLGKNKIAGTLIWPGVLLDKLLERIEKDHTLKSIEDFSI